MRRSDFLKALVAIPLAAKAVVLAASRVPRLWGDGIHDDAPAIQAMIDAGGSDLPPGTYAVGSTIVVGRNQRFHARDSHFKAEAMNGTAPVISIHHGSDYQIHGNLFSLA